MGVFQQNHGWRLTLEEVKWLFDWHLVRGNNLIDPHAVFYSIRGRRAWESDPDLCLHNVWRPYIGILNRYAQRVSSILCDGSQVCDVAILGDGDNLPWEAAAQLYRNQIEFLYVDDQAVAEGSIGDGVMNIGSQSYRAIIVEGDPVLGSKTREHLKAFESGGGRLTRSCSEKGWERASISWRSESPIQWPTLTKVYNSPPVSWARSNWFYVAANPEIARCLPLSGIGSEIFGLELIPKFTGPSSKW